MIENISALGQVLGVDNLEELIKSEEKHTIDLEGKVILPKDAYDERIKNIKTEAYNQGAEVTIKEVRKNAGLEFEGKTINNLVDAFNKKLEEEKLNAIKDPDKKYTDLKTDFEKLQSNLSIKDKEIEDLKSTFSQKEKKQTIEFEALKSIPDNLLVSKNTIILEAQSKGFVFDLEDNKVVIKENGEIKKDEKTLSPISLQSFFSEFAKPFLKPVQGGSGAGDDGGQHKAGTFEAFEKEAEKQGWNATQKNTEMAKRIKDGTLKL